MQSFVECYSGLMGGGKSFSAVQRMNRHIAQGGVVYSNILLKLDPWFNPDYPMKEFLLPVCPLLEQFGFFPDCKSEWKEGKRLPVVVEDKKQGRCWVFNSHGACFALERFHDWRYQEGQFNYISDDLVNAQLMHHLPKGAVDRPVLVVLDEALDHFESASDNTNAEFRSFLRHVRKLGLNLIFIAQDFSSLEKKIRVLTHYVWTFRDFKTWKVPVLGAFLPGGTLPLPWSDNIQQRQYHQKQFSMAKAEPVNKRTMAYRDPIIFQCYQSVSLHNASITMNGVAKDFGESGRILKGKKRMNMYERVFIYVLLGVSLWFAFKKPPQVIIPPAVSPPVPVHPEEKKKDDGFKRNAAGQIVEISPISYHIQGGFKRFWVDGVPCDVGSVTSRGVVRSASPSMIQFSDFDGLTRFVYNGTVQPSTSKPSVPPPKVDTVKTAGAAAPVTGKSS